MRVIYIHNCITAAARLAVLLTLVGISRCGLMLGLLFLRIITAVEARRKSNIRVAEASGNVAHARHILPASHSTMEANLAPRRTGLFPLFARSLIILDQWRNLSGNNACCSPCFCSFAGLKHAAITRKRKQRRRKMS